MATSFDSASGPPARRTTGTLYRDILESLRVAGFFESVRAAVAPATARTMEHPPWMLGWVQAPEFDDTLQTLLRMHGRAAVIDIGLAVARRQAGGMLSPLVRGLVAITGSKPDTIYANLDGLYNVTVRGISFEWRSEGERNGTLLLRAGPPPPPEGVLTFIEGTLHYGTELCNVRGTFERRAGTAGVTCSWSIRWQPRAG